MNVLIINPILYTPLRRGGIVKQVDSIQNSLAITYAKGFRKLGHSVTVLSSAEYRPRLKEDYDGVEIVYLPNIAKRIFKKFPNGFPILGGFKDFLKREGGKFDIVISSEAFTYTSFVAARILPEKLIVWQEVGSHVKTMKGIPAKIWHNIAVRFLMRKALFVPRSPRSQKFISQYAKRVSDEIVDHVVDRECFAPCNDKYPYFVVISQLIKRKNIELTISKFAEFCNNYDKSYELHIVGRGEELDNLRNLAQKLGVADKVIFTGFKSRKEVAEILRHATAFMTDSTGEYNMVSMMESVSCGTPVITNTVPYSSDIVKDYELGIVNNGWNYKDIINVIENIEKYSDNCIKYGEQLSYNYLVNKTIDTFRKYNENTSDK